MSTLSTHCEIKTLQVEKKTCLNIVTPTFDVKETTNKLFAIKENVFETEHLAIR